MTRWRSDAADSARAPRSKGRAGVALSLMLAFAVAALPIDASAQASVASSTDRLPEEEDPAIAEATKAVRLRQYERAVAIWREAADRGSAKAAYQLGVAYRSGRGVPKDLVKAAGWLERAASSGDPDAQYALALFYRSGIGVPRDPERALDLLGKAARAGHRQAGASVTRMRQTRSIAYSAADPRVALHRLDPREALDQAIRLNDVGAAREALARGAPVDGAGGGAQRARPLVLAIELERPQLVALLLEQRADPSLPSPAGEPPLILAARSESPGLVRALLSAGASPRVRSRSGSTALAEASRKGATETVELLIAAGSDPREKLPDGSSAADVARRAGYPALGERLKRLGAPTLVGSGSEGSAPAALGLAAGTPSAVLPPIVEAARRGDASMLRELLARDGALSIRDAEGDAPLHRAADGGHDTCVRLLLDAGADPDVRGRARSTPLMRAMASAADGSERVVATLLGRGADPHARDESGALALHYGARGATPGKLAQLARATSGFVARDVEETLERSIVNGSSGVIEALLGQISSPEGRLGALCAAVSSARDDAFALLAEAGAPLERDCGDGRSPLLVAVQSGRADRVKRLLEAGGDPEFVAPGGDSALISAASRGHAPIVALLIGGKAHVNRRGAHRATALMGAASNGHVDVVRALLEAGADPRMRSETDQTAADLATAAGHAEVTALIRSQRGGFGSWLGGSADAR